MSRHGCKGVRGREKAGAHAPEMNAVMQAPAAHGWLHNGIDRSLAGLSSVYTI